MWKIGIAMAVLLIAAIAVAVILFNQRSRRIKLQKAAMDKERDQQLEQRLRNGKIPSQENSGMVQTPYEVVYQEKGKHPTSEIQIELTVISEVSEKKYMLPVRDKISIGKSTQNDLVLSESGVSRTHCSLIRRNSDIYIKDLNSTNGTVVVRKSQKTKLQGQSVKIQTGDQIFLGSCSLEVKIFS